MGLGGAACAAVAPSKGRSPVTWFLVGALTFGAGLVVLLLLPNLKEREAAQKSLDERARQAQEALEQRRSVAYARHPDSKPLTVEPGRDGADSELHLAYQDSEWFHGTDENFAGPMPFETLHLTWLAESIDGQTLVWRKGMPVWRTIDDLDGMTTALDG